MSDLNFDQLDGLHFDVLKELGNIGAGNATTALAQMLNRKLEMKVPVVQLVGFDTLAGLVCGEEELVVGIYLLLNEDVDGSMMFLLPEKSAHRLIDLLMNRGDSEDMEFSEMDLSALQEIGNIIAGSYLSALSSLTNLKIYSSVPYISIDMAAAILSVPAIEFGKIGDKALLIETKFGDDIMIDGYFILIPALESYDKILQSLGFSSR